MKKLLNISIISIIFLPNLLFALTFSQLVNNIYSKFLVSITSLLISAAVLFFMYGIIMVIVAKSDDKKKVAKARMFWGVIILFVMFSFWSILQIFNNTLDLENESEYNYYNESFDYGINKSK